MGSHSYGPPELGADGIVRFESADHFLRELAENLRKGRLFVKASKPCRPQDEIRLEIEGPGVGWNVGAAGTVLTARKGYVGLEIKDFEAEVAPTLDLLADEVKATKKKKKRRRAKKEVTPPPGESTVVAAAPKALRMATMADPEPNTPPRPSRRRLRKVASDDALDSATVAEHTPSRAAPVRRPARTGARDDAPEVYARGDLVDDLDAKAEEATPPSGVDISDLGGAIPHPTPTTPLPEISPTEGLDVPTHSEMDAIRESDFPLPPSAPPSAPPLAPASAPAPAPVSAPAPAPDGTAAGMSALAGSKLPFPRATRSGVLKAKNPSNLLGMYLAQLRHGHITVLGGPEGEIGDEVTLKIVSAHVINLTCKIIARVGDWLTLEVEDAFGIEALLRDAAQEWIATLAEIAPNAFATTGTIPPPSLTPMPSAPPSAPPPPPEPVDDGPPELPKLEGDVVAFRRKKDLQHEVDSNLANGGLFVNSSPLPIREHRTLRVSVAGHDTGVAMEADVVFANDGKVGWSIGSFAEVVDALRKALGSGKLDAPAPAASASQPAPATISGRIAKPPIIGELLGLQSKRANSERDLERISVLSLLEYIARLHKTGVLALRLKEERITVYFHEGSVAFAQSSANDEENRIGRILVHHKKLSDSGMREGLERARASGRPLGRTLVSMGTLKQNVLSSALREQARQLIEPAFSWSVGNFEWKPWQEPPVNADLVLANGMGVVARHVRHRFEHVSGGELEKLFGDNMNRHIVRVTNADKLAQGMGLQSKELRFIELMLDGDRTISGAVTGSPLGRLASTRLVAFSLTLGLTTFSDGSSMRSGRAQPRRPTDARGEALKTAMKEHLHLMRGQNHFELIGVHWSASHRTYAKAFEKAKLEFDITKLPLKDAPLDVKNLAREAVKIIDDAYNVLKSDEQRIRYRKKIFDGTEREYSADMLVKQGEVLLLRGDRVGGIEALETAFELSPTPRIKQLLVAAREGRPL